MSDEPVPMEIEKWTVTSRAEQIDAWSRLPLTDDQRARVLAEMRRAKDEDDAREAQEEKKRDDDELKQ